ncbi:hypothetical protein FPV67DRAFT_1464486 [Lyophyllum atratum]|nr:hypothetical protein FPV67DRAFT_1464486 [Lyophyllum atratum]
MSTNSLRCQICITSQPICDFRFFPCDIASAEEEQSTTLDTLVNGLVQMDQDSKLISIQNAEKKLRRFAEKSEVVQNNNDFLLQAIEDFKKRIIPVFERATEQATMIESLKKSLETCQGDLARSARQRDEMRCNLHQMEQERDQAIELARLASNETRVSELEEKTQRYRSQLIRHSKASQQHADKISSLEQQLTDLRAQQILDRDEHCPGVELESGYSTTQAYNPRPISPATPLKPTSTVTKPLSTHTNSGCDFEAMPPPGGFRSDWQISVPDKLLKKRKLGSENEAKGGFPISLDKKGRPIGTIQLGTIRTLRAPLSR